jgi:hypothetical protein
MELKRRVRQDFVEAQKRKIQADLHREAARTRREAARQRRANAMAYVFCFKWWASIPDWIQPIVLGLLVALPIALIAIWVLKH